VYQSVAGEHTVSEQDGRRPVQPKSADLYTVAANRWEQTTRAEALGLKARAQVIAATKQGNARVVEIDELPHTSVITDPLRPSSTRRPQ
jgi:hypothetical protein